MTSLPFPRLTIAPLMDVFPPEAVLFYLTCSAAHEADQFHGLPVPQLGLGKGILVNDDAIHLSHDGRSGHLELEDKIL